MMKKLEKEEPTGSSFPVWLNYEILEIVLFNIPTWLYYV